MRQRTPPSEIILFWSHVTSVFQGLSISRSVGRVGENPGNEVELCWERSKNLSTIVAIVVMFLFSIMITLTCTCTFAWGDDYSYSVVSYKFLKDEISSRESEIASRPNDISFRRNEISLRRSETSSKFPFDSINHLACEISPTLEQ